MEGLSELGGERHFAGVMTRFLIEYLRTRLPGDEIEMLLRRSGDDRSADDLSDDSTWSSYSQMRRLLEVTVSQLGDGARLRDIGTADAVAMPEFATMLLTLGSPAAIYRDLGELRAQFAPIIDFATYEVTPTEWVCEQRFLHPFEPFKAFCDYTCGMLGVVPRVFSFPIADVVEEQCCVDGAACCRFRVRWDATDGEDRKAQHVQRQLDLVTTRLETLHATVGELVSDEGLDRVLARILASAAKAVSAPAYMLALEDLPTASNHVYAEGISDDDARRLAHQVLSNALSRDPSRLVVDVVSQRRRYGRLAALHREGGRFFHHEHSSLEAYARLAAAALDSATALEDARLQAATARTLLRLSSALAELVEIDDVASRIVQSVRELIDCDQAAVILVDRATATAHVAATHGYSETIDAALRATRVGVVITEFSDSLTANIEASSPPAELDSAIERFGSAASASCPIVSRGELIGWLSASVTHVPARIERGLDTSIKLQGLAGQAATAIRNARLVQEIRHQALHDGLTGLPNRTLILDRIEQLLVRARRNATTPSVLFVDLDGFKEVNDTLGHAAGDDLLRAAATRLKAMLRLSDTIGRLGGDEFVVLTETDGIDARPELLAERLIGALREPFQICGSTTTMTASIGIATGDRDAPGELLRDADIALYQAKGAGKNRFSLHAAKNRFVAESLTPRT